MASGRSWWWQGSLLQIWHSPLTGDAVDHGGGGRETGRDPVVAGLAQHDPGDRRPLAVDPADGPEGEAAAGRVVRAGLDADKPVVPELCWCCARHQLTTHR